MTTTYSGDEESLAPDDTLAAGVQTDDNQADDTPADGVDSDALAADANDDGDTTGDTTGDTESAEIPNDEFTDPDDTDPDDVDDPAGLLAPPEPTQAAPAAIPFAPPFASSSADLTLLQRWATENRATNDPYVGGLLEASASRQDLSMWASLDPVEMLPHPELAGGRILRTIARLLIFLRNVAVFVPVAVTWYAIRQATDAFGAYADAQPPASQLNFLRFWQSGGDGLLGPEWRIQNIALLDAIIITGIVLATMVAGVVETRASRKSARAERVAESSRIYVALAIKKALHGSRQATPESIAESLAESLSDLLGAARMIGNAAGRLEAASVGVDAMGPKFDQFNRRLEILDQHLGGHVVKSVTDLVASVGALGKTVDGDFTRVLNEVLIGLEEVQQQLSRTSSSVEFGTKQLRDDLDAIHDRLATVTQRGRA
ncbi:unannotated protein [freshwater metagenome]|uniref:Unannotated protein n=1 Tax=freshwater metagenome TaxID=449393 RepID=A0A6J7F465_9ZZZZ|nr:hypothetical protein [Actinomycetota bacterium]